MSRALARSWWAFIARGFIATLFGVTVLLWPGFSFPVLTVLFMVYAILDGLFTFLTGLAIADRETPWLAFLLGGVVVKIVTMLAAALPRLGDVGLAYVIAVWAIAAGIFELAAAIRVRAFGDGPVLGLAGLLALSLGVYLAVFADRGAIVHATSIATFLVLYGLLLLMFGARLRAKADRVVDHQNDSRYLGSALQR